MEADHRAQVEELLAEYRRSREQLGSVHRSLATITESASSADGLVTATVGAHGQLVDLVIAETAYRTLRAHELAQRVVELTERAAAQAARRAGEVLAPVLPRDADPEALLRGTADLNAAELAPAEEAEGTFEDLTWMETGGPR
ncbi:YbaB/EbfC family nucleoid-associated protein [Actinophytocola sediminis]